MVKYHFTNKAVEDLAGIWEYTFEKWSKHQANTYYEILISNCAAIANNPNLGKSYQDITPNLLGIKVQRHIIFYRIIEEQRIEITRILHERMDLKHRIVE
jgi:toxin ParE1/3/4